MGFFSYLFFGGLAAYGIHKVRQNDEEERRLEEQRIQKENRRKSHVYRFNEGLSEEVFQKIVFDCAKKIKRIDDIEVNNLSISCTVNSISGISSWGFVLDFNDYGHLTGKCYSKTENFDSNIPERLKNLICEKLEPYIETIEKQRRENKQKKEQKIKEENLKKEQLLQREKQIKKFRREKQIKKLRQKEWREKHKKGMMIFIILCIFACVITIGTMWYNSLIHINYSFDSLRGQNCNDVVEQLGKSGFTNVVLNEISDLPIPEENKANIVTDVHADGNEIFDILDRFPANTSIEITYHSVKLYNSVITSRDAKGLNYKDVIQQFEDVGFTNVKTKAKYDVITGWITKNGEVETISIDGNEGYSSYDKFRLDAEIIITYHTYKKNKPKN